MDDLGVVGILRPDNFEWQKESREVKFVKELNLNESESKLCFWTITLLCFWTIDTGKAGLTETGKIWDFEWSLSSKLDFGLEFALQIARQALEQRWIRRKRWNILYRSRCNTRLVCPRRKTRIWVELVPNRKREWLAFKTHSAKDFWVEKLELLENFEDCRELKELTVELLEERGGKSAQLN